MRGGTYACALKAGFSEDQAGFFARLGAETKQETVDYIEETRRKREVDLRQVRRDAQDALCRKACAVAFLFTLGTICGVFVSHAGWLV